jgi:hypothetical protein
MENLIAYCGIDCARCPAYIAKQTNDDGLRTKTAAEWTKAFGHEMKPADINCDGCSAPGQHILYCDQMCGIRKCAVGKQVATCAACPDYGCEILESFIKNVPEAKQTLENLRKKR